jgi:hypothetical protein
METEQTACEKCLTTQRVAQPNLEPSCGLKERMDPIGAMRPNRMGVEFGRAMTWAGQNTCPRAEIERLGKPIHEKLHPGRQLVSFGSTHSLPIADVYLAERARDIHDSHEAMRSFRRGQSTLGRRGLK